MPRPKIGAPSLVLLLAPVVFGSCTKNSPTTHDYPKTWQKTLCNVALARSRPVIPTCDGGFVVMGSTSSLGENRADIYLLKIDGLGNIVWEKTFGGPGSDVGGGMAPTADGGFIITGSTNSYGGKATEVCLIKTDASGNTVWQKVYDGTDGGGGVIVAQTSDGGFIISGGTYPYTAPGPIVTSFFLLKTDPTGKLLWLETYDSSRYNNSALVVPAADGGYMVALQIGSVFLDVDILLVKIDQVGRVVWEKRLSREGNQVGQSLATTHDGGYIIVGSTGYTSGENGKVFLIKMNASGDVLWEKTYADGSGAGRSLARTPDGGYIIAGGFISSRSRGIGVYLLKTDACGNFIWEKTIDGPNNESAQSVSVAIDGGFIIAGEAYSQVADSGWREAFLIKTDENGEI